MLSVLILTIIAYSDSLHNYFIFNLDDNAYIGAASNYHNLNFSDLSTIFGSFQIVNYHPLTLLSLAIDYNLSGMDPFFFHLVNLLFHLSNIILVFLFIVLLTGRKDAALIVAALFAVHPMHVESVAWISSRKDVLFTFFFLVSLVSYLFFLNKGRKYFYYYLSLFSFLLSLLSKSAAVCLAPVVILLDYYLGRKATVKLIFEKIPFFVLSIIFGIISLISQGTGGALTNPTPDFSVINKFFVICYSFMFYIVRSVLPINLSAVHYYPSCRDGILPFEYYSAPLGIAIILFLIIKIKSIRKELIFAVLFYFFSIALVLQFIPVGFTVVAERYSYVPYIGLFFLAGKLYSDFIKDKPGNFNNKIIIILRMLIVVIVLLFSYNTYERNKVWKNGIVLFDDIILKNPGEGHAYWARGNIKYDLKNYEGAIMDFDSAIKNNYRYPSVYNNKGNCYNSLDSMKQAIACYSEGVTADPKYPLSFYNRGNAKRKIKDYEGSVEDYKKAIEYNYIQLNLVYNAMGFSLINLNKPEEALKCFTEAVRIKPDYSYAYYNKALLEFNMKDYDNSLNDFNRLVETGPKI